MTMPVVVMTMMMTESEAKTFKCSSGQRGDRRETRAISRKRKIERLDSRDDDITEVIFVMLGLNRDDDICVQYVDGDNGRNCDDDSSEHDDDNSHASDDDDDDDMQGS